MILSAGIVANGRAVRSNGDAERFAVIFAGLVVVAFVGVFVDLAVAPQVTKAPQKRTTRS